MVTEAEQFSIIGVIGAGAMGAGIVQTALTAGLKVIVYDTNAATLATAREDIFQRISRLVEKGQISTEIQQNAYANLRIAENLAAFAPAEVVVEAIIEKLEPKQALFAALEKIVKPEAVLATNTSSLSVASIARGCERRQRICGMHFFNPVPLMKLVEVIGAPATSQDTITTALALVKRFGKAAVEVRDAPGFLVNLLGRAYSTEPQHILLEGVASAAVIDRILREACGFRMGPFELMDLTGIDVNFPATSFIWQGFQYDPRIKTTILHEALYNAGQNGRKTGSGFHVYADGNQVGEGTFDAPTPSSLSAFNAEGNTDFDTLFAQGLYSAGAGEADVVLIAPRGEDAATTTARLKLDPKSVVAVDFVGAERKFLTLMAPVGHDGRIQKVAGFLRSKGWRIATIKDSPGFVAPRVLCMIANLGCEVAQMGIGTPDDIDLSMKLAQNYPRGPLEWAAWLEPRRVFETLSQIQAQTGSDRYRPSLWLRRRALLDLPIHATE